MLAPFAVRFVTTANTPFTATAFFGHMLLDIATQTPHSTFQGTLNVNVGARLAFMLRHAHGTL